MARNLKAIRQERGLTIAALSRRMTVIGHPMLETGILKTEQGLRGIDVDDLIGFAVALGVSPAALLLPRDTAPGDEVQLTPLVTVAAWEWSSGRFPLPVPGGITWQRLAEFELRSRPGWYGPSVTGWRAEMKHRKAEMDAWTRAAEGAPGGQD